MKVLAKEFKVQVIEYKNYNQEYEPIIDEYLNEKREFYSNYMNQIENFKQFIANSVNYKNRFDFESNDGVIASTSDTSDHRLILFEEFPNVFYRQPEALHKELKLLIKKYGKRLIPIVFIISETSNGQSDEYKLLPKSLQSELNMQTISFNAITDTSIRKVLERSSDNQLSKNAIEGLIDSASGDVRCAINNMQLLYMHSIDNYCDKGDKKLAKKRLKVELNNGFVSRDPSLTVCHAIGKVLYAKPLESEDETQTNAPNLDSVCRLPPHLSDKERVPLIDSPDSIADKLVVSSDVFNAWLHQNYIDFCGDSLEKVQNCIDWLCGCDALFSGEHHFNNKPIFESYKASLAIRGLMFNLSSSKESNDAKQVPNEAFVKSKRGFKSFKKPQTFVVNRSADSVMRQISQSMSRSMSPLSPFSTTNSLVIDFIPFISQMPKHLQRTDNEFRYVLNKLVKYDRNHHQNNEHYLCNALSQSSIDNSFETNDETIFQINTNDEQKDGNVIQIDCRPIDDLNYTIEDIDSD